MPAHYAAVSEANWLRILPNPFMPDRVTKRAWMTGAYGTPKPSRKTSVRLERATAKLEAFLAEPVPRKVAVKPRKAVKRPKAR